MTAETTRAGSRSALNALAAIPMRSEPALASRAVRELLAYWRSKCRPAQDGGQIIPSRGDVDPSEIRGLLPSILIADVTIDPIRVRYRLAGTRICESFGANITGRWLHDLDVTGGVEFWCERYMEMILSRAPILGRTVGLLNGVECFRSDWALCPLIDSPATDGGAVVQSLEIEDWGRALPRACFEDAAIDWQVRVDDGVL